MSTLLKMQKIHPLCSRCIGMYPLQNRWTVLRYLQCYENFSECCTHLILPETALFSPTPTFAKEPKFQMAVEMIDLHDNAEAKAYVKKMLTKGVKMLIDNGNLQLIQVLLGKTDFVTKKNVDKYIQYAIDKKQQEIYLDLIRYKNAIMA